MPAGEVKEEEFNYVSSFDYSEAVTGFPVNNSLIGLHLSSYQVQKEGSANAAVGRDVFLLLDPKEGVLHAGQLSLGITKERIRFMGCFGAQHHTFSIADIDGDRQVDIGVKKEEIRCEEAHSEPVDVDYVVSREQLHPWRWFIFKGDRWEHNTAHESRRPAEGDLQLPLIDMVKSPIGFVRERTSANER